MSKRWPLLLCLALLLAGCAEDARDNRATQYLGDLGAKIASAFSPNRDTDSYWDGDGVAGSPSIKIHLGRQRAYFFKSGQLVGVSVISTGREGYGTKVGNFHIIQKDRDHKSSIYGDYIDAQGNVVKKDIDNTKDPKPPGALFDGAKMPFFMRITGGIGMHQGFLPGYPASHGCIRMPGFMAEAFFRSVSLGTPVSVEDD